MKIERRNGDRPYGNFDVKIECLLRPAGVQNPPMRDNVLLLEVHTDDTPGFRKICVAVRDLDQLNLEALDSSCVYVSRSARSQLAADIRSQLSDNQAVISKSGSYPPRSGWYTEPQVCFCAGNDALPKVWGDATNIYMIKNPFGYSLATDNFDEQRLVDFLRQLLAQAKIRFPVFGYTVAAHLRSLWEKEKLSFVSGLLIYGKSGTGKTTLAHNLCALYDKVNGGSAYTFTTDSRIAGLREAMYQARDLIVLDDDISRNSNTREQKRRLSEAVEALRFSASDFDRTKLNGKKAMGIRCESSLVVTSELLFDTASELSRAIIIEVKEPHSGGDPELRGFAANALKGYLSWFAEHFEVEMENLRQFAANLPAPTYPEFERLCLGIQQVQWALGSFLRFAASIPSCRPVLGKNSDPISIIRKIMENLLKNEVILIRRQLNREIPLEILIARGISNKELPVDHHKGRFLIKLDALTQYLQNETDNSSLTADTISRYLRSHQIVDIDHSGKLTKKVNRQRYVHLIPEKLN